MYILPNKNPIDIDKLCEAIEDMNISKKYYLDTDSGKIVFCDGGNIDELKNEKYFLVPKLAEETILGWMSYFAEEDIIFDNQTNLSKRLIEALDGPNPRENFMSILENDSSGWIHGWAQAYSDWVYEEAMKFFDELPIMLEDDMSELDDDCQLCRMMKEGYNSLEDLHEAFREAKAQGVVVGGRWFDEEENKYKLPENDEGYIIKLKDGDDFIMPKWEDCSWRRVPCSRTNCKICGPNKKREEEHAARGEDPNDIKAVINDVGDIFHETLELVKKDAEKMGIDLDNLKETEQKEAPKPEDFPVYNKIYRWHKNIYELADETQEQILWNINEDAQDLLWYANLVMAKTYRQLSNRWEMGNGEDHIEVDYFYTRFVLGECFIIEKRALNNLAIIYSEHSGAFNMAKLYLTGIEEEILNI